MSNALRYEDVNEELVREFPNIRSDIPMLVGQDPNPGPYVLFGSVFNDYIEIMMENEAEVERVADFIERMAADGDGRTEDLLKIEIVPTLLSSPNIVQIYWAHLGPRSRRLLELAAPVIAPHIQLPL